jgi:ribosomal protein L11 methyltransferase
MAWLALQMELTADEAESWSETLLEAGAICVDIADADAASPAERALFDEPGECCERAWPHNRLTALFARDADVKAIMSDLASPSGVVPDYRLSAVADRDWVRATQQQFAPIAISERLWIVPSWCEPPRPDAINLIVDPGLAFGTGSHPTTRLCLRWLDAHIRGGETVLDYGCGSGILAIAAAKLGAKQIAGVDIDEQAILASRENARRNGVAGRFQAAAAALESQADILVANILANPLRVLAPALAQYVRPGGAIVLSGILVEQADDVIAAYRSWFNIAIWHHDEGWAALAGKRLP